MGDELVGWGLGWFFLALLVLPPEGGRSKLMNGLEGLIETSLFFVAAVQGNRLYGVVRLQEAYCGAVDALTDYIGMHGRVE